MSSSLSAAASSAGRPGIVPSWLEAVLTVTFASPHLRSMMPSSTLTVWMRPYGIETSVRERVPVARIIYIEADVYRAAEAAPPTDTIVIKSADCPRSEEPP